MTKQRTYSSALECRAGQLQRKPPAATLPFDRETQKAFRKRRRSRSAKGSARYLEGGA